MSGDSGKRPPSGFAAQLIAALEEAQAAAQQPKPAAQLAQSAWTKLQFDFPLVSEGELAALVQEFASGTRRGINSRFLSVLSEHTGSGGEADSGSGSAPVSAAAGGEGSSGSAGGSSSGAGLVPLYQQLYAVSVLQSLQYSLETSEAEAAAWLAEAGLHPSDGTAGASALSAEGTSQLEEAFAAAAAAEDGEAAAGSRMELEHRLSQQAGRGVEDEDGTEYEPLEPAPPLQQQQHAALFQPLAAAAARQRSPSGLEQGLQVEQRLPGQLATLARHLSYHSMCDAAAWRQLDLAERLAACLAVSRRHARFLELVPAAQALVRLAVDRWVAAPAELEAGLLAVLDALAIPAAADSGSSSSSSGAAAGAAGRQAAAVEAAATELALAAAVALAAQVSSSAARRVLWQVVHQRLLPVAAQQLELQQVALARQARGGVTGAGAAAGPTPEQLYAVMLSCQLLYFYVLQAPAAMTIAPPSGGASRLQESLLRGGLLRAIVLLFVQLGAAAGAEPLRCALLLACSAAQPLLDWAKAVPGFSAALAAPALQPGGEAQLHGALWQVLLVGDGAQLAALLADSTPAGKVPAVYQALQLMADVQAVARRPLWSSAVDAALRALADTLRRCYSRPRQEQERKGQEGGSHVSDATPAADTAASGREGGAGSEGDEEDAADARKLAATAEEAAAATAARRAQQLQPACARLIKDLLQRRAGAGKHD